MKRLIPIALMATIALAGATAIAEFVPPERAEAVATVTTSDGTFRFIFSGDGSVLIDREPPEVAVSEPPAEPEPEPELEPDPPPEPEIAFDPSGCRLGDALTGGEDDPCTNWARRQVQEELNLELE